MRKQITQAIHATLPVYLQEVADPYDINCGMCEDFAEDVLVKLGGRTDALCAVWIEDLIDTPYPDACHKVIRWTSEDGVLYFDSECPEGVPELSQIPAIANEGKTREEVIQCR